MYLSVALCTWNGEKFLPQQLDSLLTQRYSNGLRSIVRDLLRID